MNVLIVTFGGLGDVLPYVALGKGLKARGHSVTLCTNSSFESFVTEHGLNYAYMNDGFTKLLKSNAGRDAIENLTSFFGGIKIIIKMAKQLGPLQRLTLNDAWDAAKTSKPDLIIFYPKASWAVHFAGKLSIPVIAAPLFPQFVPTSEFPSIGFPNWKLGGWYNKLTYNVVLKLSNLIGGQYVREWRAANNLPPKSGGIDLLHNSVGERIPVLHGYSHHVAPVPADWPDVAQATGFWFLDQQDAWQAPSELEAFLDAGDPPVYVGFGSMAGRNPQRVTQIVIEALRAANVRGVIATGWGGLKVDALPDRILKLEYAPHDWLFPRMAAVVHHGGAGTTAAGIRAGCPTVVCPFFGDQTFWGRRVHELGVGTEPIPQNKLTVENLAAAIRESTFNPMLRKKAEALGERIRQEDGVAEAIVIVDRAAMAT